jgi:hypothetical protein
MGVPSKCDRIEEVGCFEKAPKRFFAFLYHDRYIVRVNTIDALPGIPIVIELHRGIEGKSTALNPLIFKPLPDP